MKTRNDLSAIGNTLKEERAHLGLTQVEAAKQFKISLKALRNLEQGYGGVTLATTAQILEYLGKQIRVGDIVSSPARKNLRRARRSEVIEVLNLVKPVLEKKFGVEKIALFGSTARDVAKKTSDIDIAVHFNRKPNLSSIGRLTVFLESLFDGRKVDLVEFESMIPQVKVQAEKDFIYV